MSVALILQAVLAVDCARRWTPTHDEYWHLPIGLRMWTLGRFDDDVINPPAVRMLAAVPLMLGGAKTGTTADHPDVGEIGDAFWRANLDQVRTWFLAGRLMIVPLSAVTGLVLVLWSRAWYGDGAAMVAVLLWACCPTAIANSAIVTHDLPLTATWMLTLGAIVRFAKRPTWTRGVLFGLALGFAILAKLTAIALVPLSLIVWWGLRVATLRTSEPSVRRVILGQWAAAFAMAALVINVAYGFRGTGSTLTQLSLASSPMKSLQRSFIGRLPLPVPTELVGAFDRLAQDLDRSHPVYLDGSWASQSIPAYYLFALLYKLPISTLVLAMAGVAATVWPRRESLDRRHGVVLLAAALFLPVMASQSPNQIGIRYVLPAIPVLIVFASQSARWFCMRPRSAWTLTVTGAVLLAPLSLRHHPHHLAYFNVLAGGPSHGGAHLLDSNIDWGQDLFALKDFLDREQVSDVGLAYFGTVIPGTIGISSHRPPSGMPQAGWYAISVNYVNGRPHVLRDDAGNRSQVALDEFGYFRFFEPTARIGYSINVYRITPQDLGRFARARQRMLYP